MTIQEWLVKTDLAISKRAKEDKNTQVENAIIKLYLAKHLRGVPALMSYEFVGGTLFPWMSHKAPARASDAVLYYPNAVCSHNLPKKMKAYELYNEQSLPKELLAKCEEFMKILAK